MAISNVSQLQAHIPILDEAINTIVEYGKLDKIIVKYFPERE
jgi:hypothetical protein